MGKSGNIFSQYKCLGHVSNDVPLITRYIKRRKENLIVTSVGRSFHTYGCSHFGLLSISGQHDEEISCIAGDTFHVYTAAGQNIYAWRRGCELKRKYVGHEYLVHSLLPFATSIISVDEESNLKVWDIKTEECLLDMQFQNSNFQITCMMHPATYLNKILLGSEQGSMHLLNIHSQSIIYTFKGWDAGVGIIAQSPALHVVGIGLKNGRIILHNLKMDETVMTFQQEWGAVMSLAFRTDAPFMISGATNGRMIIWDLENRRVFSQLTNAHYAAVTGLQCLPDEPLMVSSSPDNSLKLWIFDKADGSPRLLRIREGHSSPPSFIRFHGANGQNMLSAGADSSLRIFNTVTEIFNKSLGRASYNRKASKRKGRILDDTLTMPPIVAVTSETTREKEWDNIAAIHLGIPAVTTWSYEKLKMGDLRLLHRRFVRKKFTNETWIKATATCVTITHCGNYAVVGYSSGHCERYNIQSGIHRASYGDPGHKGAVRGVAVDNLNQAVVTGGSDSYLRWWHFSKCLEIAALLLDSATAFFCHHGESGVLAIALDDYSITLVDTTERTAIRHFPGHSSRLTDAAFSPDARWLITAGMDKKICTWDVPSGCLVDVFKVESACTSLSFSPTAELLATTHVDSLGVYLWFNRTLYTHISLRPLTGEHAPTMELPGSVSEKTVEEVVELENDEETDETCQQIGKLVTLSGLPPSRWLNLLNIDVIRRRNRPTEPVKQAAAAPFFLPTIPALDVRFDFSNIDSSNTEESIEKLMTATPFSNMLRSTATNNDFDNIIVKLKSMGPSAINYEINAIGSDDEGALLQLMRMLREMLKSGRDAELAQAYLGLFLKVHGGQIARRESLRELLPKLQFAQNESWRRLETKYFYTLAIVDALKNL